MPTRVRSKRISSKSSKLSDGFIKLPRHLLTLPEFEEMYEKESVYGGWFYIIINLELCNASSHWLQLSGKLLDRFAKEIHKSRTYVKHLITDYPDLFIVEGDHFTSHWMVKQFNMEDEPCMEQNDATPARTYIKYAGDIDIGIDKEKKENKEMGLKVSDYIGPSAYEKVDIDGCRHGNHGELVPWWAAPQTDVYSVWSVVANNWVAQSDVDQKAEKQKRQEMKPEDFKMATAYETLAESDYNRIIDNAKRI